MKYLLFGDIHGNIDALTVFLSEWDRIREGLPVCLGDVVGYGAAPNECVQAIRDLKIPCVQGNHEYAVFHESMRQDFNEYARNAVEWTALHLTNPVRDFLESLPFTLHFDTEFSLTHGDFSAPAAFHYISGVSQAMLSFSAMDTSIGFFGHTHIPVVYRMNPAKPQGEQVYVKLIDHENERITLQSNRLYLINPGSIGQPRDGDPRASYLIFDSDAMDVQYRRLSYDWGKAAQRILNAGLPSRLADRLFQGY